MKRILLISIATFFVFQGSAQNQTDKGFVINGKLRNAGNKIIYLTQDSYYMEVQNKDSVVADNTGKFVFKGLLKEPALYVLRVQNKPNTLTFYLENSKINISGSIDSISLAKITGSKENEIFRQQGKFINECSNELGRMDKILDSVKRTKDTSAINFFEEKRQQTFENVNEKIGHFLLTHPSFCAINLLNPIVEDYGLSLADSLLKIIESTDIGRKSLEAKHIRMQIDIKKSLAIGKLAPDFVQKDTSGKDITLTSFRGKYLLLDFWAEWCGPCRAENPNLVNAYNKYNGEGFSILSVSLDDNKKDWLKAINKDHLTWTQVSDLRGWNNVVAKQYSIDFIPFNYLINPQGKIIAVNLRGDELTRKLKEIYSY